jgi:S-adenosyl-L-methionine hydrolase (adenosine-forming)
MIVTLLTDYGHDDEFVGVCHAVVRRAHPGAEIVDLSHGIARHAVREGALVLRNTLPYLPVGVHVAIVDPQVGTERRALALGCADGRVLVGPDNGVLSLAWSAAGGVVEAYDISRSRHRLEPVSATFHGRDLFAPVAAHLAAGAPLAEAGEPLDPDELRVLELPTPRREGDALVAHAVTLDGYGNVGLDAGHADLLAAGLRLGRALSVGVRGLDHPARVVATFADVAPGELLVYEDPYGALALAVNRGSAAASLGLELDDEVRLSPR